MGYKMQMIFTYSHIGMRCLRFCFNRHGGFVIAVGRRGSSCTGYDSGRGEGVPVGVGHGRRRAQRRRSRGIGIVRLSTIHYSGL